VFAILAACLETLLDKDARKRCDSLLREQQQGQQEQLQEQLQEQPRTKLRPTPGCPNGATNMFRSEQEQVLQNARNDDDRAEIEQFHHGKSSNTSLAQSSQSRSMRGRSSSRSHSTTTRCARSGSTRSTRTVMLLRDDSIDTIRCSSGSASGNRRRGKNRRRAGEKLQLVGRIAVENDVTAQLVGRIAVENDVTAQAAPDVGSSSFDLSDAGDAVLAARASNEQPCRIRDCQISNTGKKNHGASKSSLLGESTGQNSVNDGNIVYHEKATMHGNSSNPKGQFQFFFRCGQQPPSLEQDIPEMDASSSSNDDGDHNGLAENDSFDSSQNTVGTRTRLREIHYTENETNRLFGGPLQLLFRARRWKPFTDPYLVFAQVFGSNVSLGEGIGAIPDPLPRFEDTEAERNSSAMTDQTSSAMQTLSIGAEPIWNLPLLVPAVSSSTTSLGGVNKKLKRRRRNKRNKTGSDEKSSSEILPNGTTCITTTRILRDRRLTRTEVVRLDPETGQRFSDVTVTSESIDNEQASDSNNNRSARGARSKHSLLSVVGGPGSRQRSQRKEQHGTPPPSRSTTTITTTSRQEHSQFHDVDQQRWCQFDDCGLLALPTADCSGLVPLPTTECGDCSNNNNNNLCGLLHMFRQ
jgi:hypothetical protein